MIQTCNTVTCQSPQTISPEIALERNQEFRERALIVDDSRTARKVLANYLSKELVCVEAGSFDEAISELRKRDFAVVITDIIMPGRSGIELLRKIVEDFPTIEVIIVSAIDRPQRALDAVRLGAFDYIIKPCEREVLEITVERALSHRQLRINADRSRLDLERKNKELMDRKVQLERLQAQVIQSEKMASLGQLAAGIAHELNNPVGFIHANMQMLGQYVIGIIRLLKYYDQAEAGQRQDTDAARIKEQIGYPQVLDDIQSIVDDCIGGSVRIRDIVKNIRTFSRLDEAEFKETDIHEGIDSSVRLLSRYFTSGNIKLVRKFCDLPLIGTFSGQLNQVWMNLLTNAAQAIGTAKGVVEIGTSFDDENIYVAVTDTGCGIPVQNLNRVFDPFFTTKPIGEGTGLGLSISFGIVERHGGDITIRSRLNEGTTFKVRIPRHIDNAIESGDKSIARYVAI